MKGSPNKAEAEKFLRVRQRSAEPEEPAAEDPLRCRRPRPSTALIDKKVLPKLATAPQNIATALPINDKFWLENLDKLIQRFNAWVAK